MRKYRSEPRSDTIGPAELHWQIGAGYVRSTSVTVQDTSHHGMGIQSPIPFAIGSTLQIKTGGQLRFATVRRCFRVGSHHFLGLEFEQAPPEGYGGSSVVIPKAKPAFKKSRPAPGTA